jgi:hypothetical protein
MSENLPLLRFAAVTLVLEGMSPKAVQDVIGPLGWIWDPRVEAWRWDALEYHPVHRALRASGLRFDNRVP